MAMPRIERCSRGRAVEGAAGARGSWRERLRGRPMSSRPDIPESRGPESHGTVWRAVRAWFSETDGLARSLSNGSWMLIERLLAMISAIVVSVWVARYLG